MLDFENLAPTLFILGLLAVTFSVMFWLERRRKPLLFATFQDKLHYERLFTCWDDASAREYKRYSTLKGAWQGLSEREIWYRYNLSRVGFSAVGSSASSAYRWYLKQFRKTQDAEAACYLGLMCLTGAGTEQSGETAYTLLQQAGQGGVANALTAQELMLLRELPVKERWPTFDGIGNREEEAVSLFRQTSTRGDPVASLNLAFCFEQGVGVEANAEMAMEHYLVAANKGEPAAQYRLSLLYETWADLSQAYTWAFVAAACSESDIARNRYQSLGRQMHEAELARAHQLATHTANRILAPRMQALVKAARLIRTLG